MVPTMHFCFCLFVWRVVLYNVSDCFSFSSHLNTYLVSFFFRACKETFSLMAPISFFKVHIDWSSKWCPIFYSLIISISLWPSSIPFPRTVASSTTFSRHVVRVLVWCSFSWRAFPTHVLEQQFSVCCPWTPGNPKDSFRGAVRSKTFS